MKEKRLLSWFIILVVTFLVLSVGAIKFEPLNNFFPMLTYVGIFILVLMVLNKLDKIINLLEEKK